MKPRISGISLAIVIALIAAQALFVASYITHEHTIYYWDHAMYFNMARQLHVLFTQDFADGWRLFRQSLANNYNLIFALPSLISFSLFEPTRLVFILTNYFVFFLAYEVAVAFLLRRALKCAWGWALIISLSSSAAIPPLWLPLLEGYPDSGAAACLVAAAALTFGKVKHPARNALLVGIALGFAVLLRRHFVYPAIALVAALACLRLIDILGAKKKWREGLKSAAIYFTFCGLGFIGILFLIAPDFVHDAISIDYGALYRSYRRTPGVFLYFILGGFGYGLLLIAISGLALLAQLNAAGRRLAGFTALYAFLWLIVWCGGPDQMGHHYILHALPLFISIGIIGWIFYLAKQPREKKYVIGAVVVVFLIANSAWVLWFSPIGVWPNNNSVPGLLSAARPPVVRKDYDEWLRLADYLQRTTKPEDRIMMIGSSFVFNQDLMQRIYADILHDPAMIARFVFAPEIDHESPAPLNAFAAANIYLVPSPAQYHLDPAGQRVVTAAANQIPPPPSRLAMFHPDDAVFHLESGATVRVWRRDQWTPGDLHAALDQIRSDGPVDVDFAQDWATLTMPLRAEIRTDQKNHTSVDAFFDQAHKSMMLFFDYPLPGGDQHISMSMRSNCPDPQFSLRVVSGDGYEKTAKTFAIGIAGDISQVFKVPAHAGNRQFLELGVSVAPASLCQIDLRDLIVEAQL